MDSNHLTLSKFNTCLLTCYMGVLHPGFQKHLSRPFMIAEEGLSGKQGNLNEKQDKLLLELDKEHQLRHM